MILTLEASNAAELRAKIEDFAKMLGIELANQQPCLPFPVSGPVAPATQSPSNDATSYNKYYVNSDEVSVAVSETKKKTRKKKETPPTEVEAPSQEEVEEIGGGELVDEDVSQASVAAATITRDQVISALQAFTAEKGMDAARALLTRYGARKISDIAEINYKSFMDEIYGNA